MSNSRMVQMFIEAKDKRELVKKMLQKNVEQNASIKFEIMKDGKGWVAWYYTDIIKENSTRRQ